MTTLYFLVSLCVLCAMIGSKLFEFKLGRVHFVSKLFSRGDNRIKGIGEQIVFTYNRYKNIARIFVFEFIPSYVYELLVRMKDYVARKYYLAGEDFRGRRVLRNRGSVSFFLQRITEEKPNTEVNKV